MSDEQLTPEEAEAFKAMEQDTGEGIESDQPATEPEPEEPKAAEPDEGKESEGEGAKPEFKSSRTDDQKPPEGYVPHQAMHAERVKRQELERRLAEIEARQQAPKEEPPKYVDPLEDPEGYRRYDEWRTQNLESKIEQQNRALQRQQQERAIYADVSKSEAEFQAKAADYPQAIEHLYNSRVSELQGMGYGQQEIQAQIQRDTHGLYQAARQIGMNPAELAYRRAESLGYQRPQATSQQPAAPEKGQSEADKMQALAKAQDATAGLTSSGAPQEGALTVEQLAKMSEDELAKIPEDQFKKAMGG